MPPRGYKKAKKKAPKQEKPAAIKKEPQETTQAIRGFLYHTDEQPRIFESGEVVPPGWNKENRRLWNCLDNGEWSLR